MAACQVFYYEGDMLRKLIAFAVGSLIGSVAFGGDLGSPIPLEAKVAANTAEIAALKVRVSELAAKVDGVPKAMPATVDADYAGVLADVSAGSQVVIAVGVPAPAGARTFPAGFLGRAAGLWRCFRDTAGVARWEPSAGPATAAPSFSYTVPVQATGSCPGGNCGAPSSGPVTRFGGPFR